MTVKQLIAVLEGMDPDREVVCSAREGAKVRGVGTIEVAGKPVAVIR